MLRFILLKKKVTSGEKTAYSDDLNHNIYLSKQEVSQLANKEKITVTIE